MWQTWVVVVALAVAVGYMVRHIYRTLTFKEDACEGCALAKNCNKKQKKCQNICQCR